MTAPTADPSGNHAARLLRLAALVCLAEGAALVVLAVIEVVNLDSGRLVVGITTTIFFVLYAAGLVAAAIGLARARSWARAPLMLSELIQVGLAWSFHGPGTDPVAPLLAVSALFVIVVLVLPSTTTALYGDREARAARPARPESVARPALSPAWSPRRSRRSHRSWRAARRRRRRPCCPWCPMRRPAWWPR